METIAIKSTGKKDSKGNEIKEEDTLINLFGHKYKVKYGDFTINYAKPFSIDCLGFYIEYENEAGQILIDSFAMLELKNVEVIKIIN